MGSMNLSLMVAAATPVSTLIEALKEGIKTYEDASSKTERATALDKLQVTCLLMAAKRVVPTMDSVENISQKVESLEKISKLIQGGNQN